MDDFATIFCTRKAHSYQWAFQGADFLIFAPRALGFPKWINRHSIISLTKPLPYISGGELRPGMDSADRHHKAKPVGGGPALKQLPVRDEDVARLSPLSHEHINMLGHYAFTLPEHVARGELRPLRNPDQASEEG